MMNQYEKRLKELKEYYQYRYTEYVQDLNELKAKAQKECDKYNGHIGVINSERHNLREELRLLYGFLQALGNVGVPITVFDYVIEVPESIRIDLGASADIDDSLKKNGGFGDALLFIASPIAGLAVAAGKGLLKIFQDKENLLREEERVQQEYAKWETQKDECNQLIKFYKTAAEIADMYRGIVATVRDTIKDKIIPEIDGVSAFLSAYSVKEAIIAGEDPDEARVVKIEEFGGTAYDQHYVFVKNTFEYYQMIKAFFTEPILTKIVSDRKITTKEKADFKKRIKDIEDHGKLLKDAAVFGGQDGTQAN